MPVPHVLVWIQPIVSKYFEDISVGIVPIVRYTVSYTSVVPQLQLWHNHWLDPHTTDRLQEGEDDVIG